MSLFKKAAATATPEVKVKANAKKELPLDGLQEFAELVAMQQALTGLIESKGNALKARGFATYLNLSKLAGGSVPDSWVGVDGLATCSMEARKRGTNSALSVEEISVLESIGVTAATQVIRPQLFAINPAYAENEEMLGAVSAAIEKIVPEDFIIQQAEVSKRVVDVANESAAWKSGNENAIAIVTTMGIKPKLKTVNFDDIVAKVGSILTAAETEVEEA